MTKSILCCNIAKSGMTDYNLNLTRTVLENGIIPRLHFHFDVRGQTTKNFFVHMVDGNLYLATPENTRKERIGKSYVELRNLNMFFSAIGSQNELDLFFDLNEIVIKAIENNRKGDDVHLSIDLFLLGNFEGENIRMIPTGVEHEKIGHHIRIPHNDWLKILQEIKYKSITTFEMVTNFPSSLITDEISGVVKNLENAQAQLNNYEARNCIGSCRDALEGLDRSLKAFLDINNFQFSTEEQERISKNGKDDDSIRNRIRLEHIIKDKTKAERIHECKAKLRHICSSFGSHEGTEQEIYYHEANSVLQMTLAMVSLISGYLKK